MCLGSDCPQLWLLGQTFGDLSNGDDSHWQLLPMAHGERKIPWLSLSVMATALNLHNLLREWHSIVRDFEQQFLLAAGEKSLLPVTSSDP